ncbi:hypothetical protein [Ramlibacter sp.]|uniref:hypothetical protein n=1 Tax=Ramlibacter sp. TaxID=1917967 RepID=UPI003D09DFBC
MRNLLRDYLTDSHDLQRIAIAIAKGHASRSARRLDPRRPPTWEFSGFSQNGEDGILDVLLASLRAPTRDCLEIGAADGVQNNTTWLALTQLYRCVMVEGNPALSAKARRLLGASAIAASFENRFVTRDNAAELIALVGNASPDLLSLDIDGIDWHVAQALLRAGLRPKVVAVEYNSTFGPERSVTIPYAADFDYGRAHATRLYYGASLRAWRSLFEPQGYRFVTVDRNGVNAFFADPAALEDGFLDAVQPHAWAENVYQVRTSGARGEAQFALIRDMELLEV